MLVRPRVGRDAVSRTDPPDLEVEGLQLVRVHPWCGRPLSEHPPEARAPGAACPFPAQAPVEFARDDEPRVRVLGLPDTVHLPGDVMEALDHLARVCRTAYGMGVEVEADRSEELSEALDVVRRGLGL